MIINYKNIKNNIINISLIKILIFKYIINLWKINYYYISNRNFDEPDYNLDGDSLIQLDDGRILSFYFKTSNYSLKIYEQKEFKEVLSIDLKKF